MLGDLGTALQENIIVLLTFDKERAKIVRGVIDLSLFSGIYRELATQIYDYIDKFHEPPGDHLADLLEDKLNSGKKRETRIYRDLLESIYEMQERINADYVMSQLTTFVKRQALRSMASDLIKALQRDTEESLVEADELIQRVNVRKLTVFDPGIRLSDKVRALKFLENSEITFSTGIPELDKRKLGPMRKGLILYISRYKSGKSFWLTHLAKSVLMHRLKVLHVTLEMSDDKCAERYMQAFFAISKRKGKTHRLKFKKDKLRRLTGFKEIEIRPRISLDDSDIYRKLEHKIEKFSKRILKHIFVKEFPTGQLTSRELEAYLDSLEATERFIPDLLIVDYPDLMTLDPNNLRMSLDEVYKNLRGIAVQRNIAVAVVSQSHRAAAKSKRVGGENVAEHYGKVAHADCILTYSQTPAEKALGLARISVDGARYDEDGITIIISQSYGTAQYVIDSALMTDNYYDMVKEELGDSKRSDREVSGKETE